MVQRGIVLSGNSLGGNCLSWKFSGWELSVVGVFCSPQISHGGMSLDGKRPGVAFVRVLNIRLRKCSLGQISVRMIAYPRCLMWLLYMALFYWQMSYHGNYPATIFRRQFYLSNYPIRQVNARPIIHQLFIQF